MARSGTSAWLPRQPDQHPASGDARAGTRAGGAVERGARSTRPFRFGSEDEGDPDPPLEAGAMVGGRYRVLRSLGEGGMGRVYEAEHTVLRRHVALKLLRRDAASEAENLARFQQEALAASRIGAPEIVEIVDFDSHLGASGRQTYMVMELLVGESLEQWMARPRPLDEGLELLAQLCDGLAAAHRAGVIHRDIKPANVFCIARDETAPADARRVKILDFGIAKITAGGPGFQTQRGALLGTPYYFAPERVRGAQLSPAADIYSVGVIFYELLTGNVPFIGESFMGILSRHLADEPLDPRQAAPERSIPDALARACLRLLAKDPDQRPSAEALATELRGYLRELGPALAKVMGGMREVQASAGEDTQILEGDPDAAPMAERETLAPDTHAEFDASAATERARSTELGHGAAGSSLRAEPMAFAPSSRGALETEPTETDPATVEASEGAAPRSERSRVFWVAAGIAALAGVGGLAVVMQGDDASAVPERDRDAAEQQSQPALDPPAEPVEPAAPEPVEPPETPRDLGAPEIAEPPPSEPSEPGEEAETKPRKRRKPAPKPQDAPEALDPDPPDPEPEPPKAEPEPPKPPPEESAADSQLPTIKDDVYD